MTTNHKKLITFTPSLLKFLNKRSRKLEITASELLRRLVEAERERVEGSPK